MKVAVVRNRSNKGVISRINPPCLERYGRRSVQSVTNALRAGGHQVTILEGDVTLLPRLVEYMPPDPRTGQPTGMVFNMSYGIQGESRYSHVPAMLEMAGVPYTGPGPVSHTVSLDKILTKLLFEKAGIPTPRFCVMYRAEQNVKGLRFPLVVKPRHESTSMGIELVTNRDELRHAVEVVLTEFQQDALVEEYIDGREVAVAILGNDPVQILPIVELDFNDRPYKILTKPDKFHRTFEEPAKICPAPLTLRQTEQLHNIALAAFQVCQCRDYSRLDVRLDKFGNPFVLEINSMATLGQKGGFVLAAREFGYSFKALVWRILDIAHERYFGQPVPIDDITPPPPADGQRIQDFHPAEIHNPAGNAVQRRRNATPDMEG